VLLLFENQKSIEEYTLNLIKPLKIRWLSFIRAAARICDVYKAIYMSLKQLAVDDAHAKGLKNTMGKLHTLLWIHVQSDVLPSLNFVLSNLEKENVDVALVHTCIEISVNNLEETFMRERIKSSRYERIRDQIIECKEKYSN
jgi:hypothetical protein